MVHSEPAAGLAAFLWPSWGGPPASWDGELLAQTDLISFLSCPPNTLSFLLSLDNEILDPETASAYVQGAGNLSRVNAG